jgi:serine phosphatase RsbU (regulator of sigma subunit)
LPTLAWTKRKKLNELIEAINEKDELLESQEDFLIKENKKYVKLKNAYAQEVEKCENLSKELSICHDSISSLRNENASLVLGTFGIRRSSKTGFNSISGV